MPPEPSAMSLVRIAYCLRWKAKNFNNSFAKLLVDPEVDEEVCEIVDVDDKSQVSRDEFFCSQGIN